MHSVEDERDTQQFSQEEQQRSHASRIHLVPKSHITASWEKGDLPGVVVEGDHNAGDKTLRPGQPPQSQDICGEQ
jgi:hypothetical protein